MRKARSAFPGHGWSRSVVTAFPDFRCTALHSGRINSMLPPLPIPPISGAEAVVAWFGLWPSFHDAEILSLETNRRATSLSRLHAWTRRAILSFFVFLGAGLGVAACDSLPLSDPLNPTPLQPRIAEITITGPTSVSVSGLPVQFKATAVFSGGAT